MIGLWKMDLLSFLSTVEVLLTEQFFSTLILKLIMRLRCEIGYINF